VSKLDFSRFRVITFDCYGTLIDWERGIFAALRPILAAHAVNLSDAELLRLYSELELYAESAEYRRYREILRDVVRGFGNRLGFQPNKKEQESLADSVATWKPFPDTVAALRKLKAKYRLAIISNIDDDLFAVTAPKLQTSFDQVITAQQAGAYKPSLKTFHLAETRLRVPREQWLHAGQSVYHDVIPAKSLGISTVWVNRTSTRPGSGAAIQASGEPDLEIATLQELAADAET
jgi:2-haloacid dehalogenase